MEEKIGNLIDKIDKQDLSDLELHRQKTTPPTKKKQTQNQTQQQSGPKNQPYATI